MYAYICEYCRSSVIRKPACPNCGAPVPLIHPATNVHNNPRFRQISLGELRGKGVEELQAMWAKRRAKEES